MCWPVSVLLTVKCVVQMGDESEENGTLPPTETSHPPSQVLEEEDQGQEQEQGPGGQAPLLWLLLPLEPQFNHPPVHLPHLGGHLQSLPAAHIGAGGWERDGTGLCRRGLFLRPPHRVLRAAQTLQVVHMSDCWPWIQPRPPIPHHHPPLGLALRLTLSRSSSSKRWEPGTLPRPGASCRCPSQSLSSPESASPPTSEPAISCLPSL